MFFICIFDKNFINYILYFVFILDKDILMYLRPTPETLEKNIKNTNNYFIIILKLINPHNEYFKK